MIFVSERQEDFYTQRKFELQNLLVNIADLGFFMRMKILFRQGNLVRSFIGQISSGQIMVHRIVPSHFYNYWVMFVIVVLSIHGMAHPSSTAVLVSQPDRHQVGSKGLLSSGIGRSGTFVLVDSILKMVKAIQTEYFIRLFSNPFSWPIPTIRMIFP